MVRSSSYSRMVHRFYRRALNKMFYQKVQILKKIVKIKLDLID